MFAEEELPVDDTGELLPLIVRRKKFVVIPMNEDEAVEQMRLLGHNNFFVFLMRNTIQFRYYTAPRWIIWFDRTCGRLRISQFVINQPDRCRAGLLEEE